MSNIDSKMQVVQQALKASVVALMPRAVRQLEVKFGEMVQTAGQAASPTLLHQSQMEGVCAPRYTT